MPTPRRTWLLLPLLLWSCSGPPAEEGGETRTETAAAVAPEEPGEHSSLRLLDFDASRLPAGLADRGEVVAGAHWTDGYGENLLLLTQTGELPAAAEDCEDCRDAEVYAYDFIREGEAWRPLWQLVDFERGCPLDLYAGFLPGSLSITDLDGDGLAESTFLYTIACRSDVSPARLKLIMREGTAKYAIRGTTRLPEVGLGGEMVLDPAFSDAPAALLAFAREQWERYVAQDGFLQF